MIINTRIRFLLLLPCVLAINCANLTGGNGSETTNGFVQGQLMQSDGYPAPYTRVSLVPVNYNPVKEPAIDRTMTDTTDEAGFYTLKTARPGAYNIQAMCLVNRTSALVAGITVTANETLHQPGDTLRIPGRLQVMITGVRDSGYVYIAGTTIRAMVIDNVAVFDEVPAGYLPALYYCNTADSAQNHLIQTGAAVKPGDTATIADYAAWKYHAVLNLNTTASGAGVTGNVTNFPVLVRLTAGTFNFAEAKSNGGDIRFAKADGSPLPYEIEQWDSAKGLACLWVKIDTVRGNNSAQYFVMRWGNTAAQSASSGSSVFDTTSGFQGVWHLGEQSGETAYDATLNRYNGTMTAALGATGAVGGGCGFDGVSSSIRMTGTASSKLDFPKNGHYTISAWVYAAALDSGVHAIAGKGPSVQYHLTAKWNQWMAAECLDSVGWEVTAAPATAGSWKLVTGVRSGVKQYLYVDGRCIDSAIAIHSFAGNTPRWWNDDDFYIGGLPDNPLSSTIAYAFNGTLDEVRVLNTVAGADWIKLCYMNQKAVDMLVRSE